jgi:hypothetical protein
MCEPFSRETLDLLDAADRAIARSRDLVAQRRQLIATWELARQEQEVRFVFCRQREAEITRKTL